MKIGLREASTYLFIVTEVVAWFAIMRAIGTAVVQSSFDRLADQIAPAAAFPGDGRAPEAFAIAREGAENALGGPSLLILLIAAFGAFALVRTLAGAGFPLALGAAVGLAASLLALHVLVHLAVYNNLRIWEQSPLATVFDSSFEGGIDATTFIANPDADLVKQHAMLLIAVLGITALWVRFLVAGRGPMTYERAVKSFTIGFGVVLVAAIVGQGVGTDQPSFIALVFFVLGALSLAAAHMARSRTTEDSVSRDAPMAIAAVASLGAIVLVALLFGLLALLEVQRAFEPMISFVLTVIGRVLYILLTPIFWAVNWVLTNILAASGLELPEQFRQFGQETAPPEEEPGGSFIPGWVLQAARVLAIAAVVWLLYRVSRLVFDLTRRRELDSDVNEERTAAGRGGGLGGLMRGLFARRKETTWSGDWLRRQPIYRLYARLVTLAAERGVERGPGDTPIEFAQRAGAHFDTGAFEPIGLAFDGARYGRHYPSRETVDSLERALREWEERPRDATQRGGTPDG